jgi:hypothetical protein
VTGAFGGIYVGKWFVFVSAFFLYTLSASAQIPKGNVYVGYAYERFGQNSRGAANLNGWEGSVEGKFLFHWFGLVADANGDYGRPSGISVKQYNFLAGPRISFSLGKTRLFVHVLGGLGELNNSIAGFSDTDHSFTYAAGGGFDHKLFPLFSWRVQGDYLRTQFFGATQKSARVSTGLVFNF